MAKNNFLQLSLPFPKALDLKDGNGNQGNPSQVYHKFSQKFNLKTISLSVCSLGITHHFFSQINKMGSMICYSQQK